MNERLNDVVTQLLADRNLVGQFRTDPESVAGRFGLSAEETEALKSGDELRLVALGLDPDIVVPRQAPTRDWSSTMLRMAARAATPLVAAAMVVMAGAIPARADTNGARATIRLIRANVVGRATLRAGQRADLRAVRARTADIRAHRAGLAAARFAIPGGKELP